MSDVENDEEMEDDDGNISRTPSGSADDPAEIEHFISARLREKFDVYSYRHAAALLASSHADDLAEIEKALMEFSITVKDFQTPGGNESIVPKKFSEYLRPNGWRETRIQADLVVKLNEYTEERDAKDKWVKHALEPKEPIVLSNYIDGHKIDYVKGQVAFDLEWNSKDQTFDRDLFAFRMFHECGIISLAVIVTRSEKLNELFNVVPRLDKEGRISKKNGKVEMCKAKFGASTTWMGKLLYRLNAGRHGGCPVLVFGIRPESISDWPEYKAANKL